MASPSRNEDAPGEYIDREHTTFQYIFILSSVSMCITVDILQYSMPLAFLPSVLEDRGHSPMSIATAIGVYYWTGLLGGLMLTSYEIWKLLYGRHHEEACELTPMSKVKRQLRIIIASLGVGVITLLCQAYSPRWHVHTTCRFIQGFVGAFLFFYVFLLNVAIFKGQQQVTAMTFASCATVLAELAGPLCGSLLFDAYGQRSVFWFLGAVSFFNQGMLVGVYYSVRADANVQLVSTSHAAKDPSKTLEDAKQPAAWYSFLLPQPRAWTQFTELLKNSTFICAVLIITMAGIIKGSVEEMLPFHADHQWGYDPMMIGQLFCSTAVAYFVAAALVSQVWIRLGRFQVAFSAHCILLLGVTSWMSFHVAYYYKKDKVLFAAFASYGFCAGLAFTAAAQLIAEVVDSAEGGAKDAANGMWNTMWEAGGSLGFFLGGFLAHHYGDQRMLTNRYLIGAVVTALCMLWANGSNGYENEKCGKAVDKFEKVKGYGSTA